MDCSVCKREAKVLGFLIVLPTAFGIFFAVAMCFTSVNAANNMMSLAGNHLETAGMAFNSKFDIWCPLCVGICSLAVGLTGWLYIMKKKLYKCVRCTYIMERS